MNTEKGDVALNLLSWDFGLGAERRVILNFWASVDAGIGGMRGVSLSVSAFEKVEFDVDFSLLVGLVLKFRPSVH